MIISAGQLLISAASLEDPHFDKVVICLTSCNADGAMGFVINERHPRSLNELVEFSHCRPLPLYLGGPMENESLYVLHRKSNLVTDSTPVAGNIFLGGDFKQTIKGINDGSIEASDIKLLIGYCGWDAGQLEAEIEEGSWVLCEANEEAVFSQAPDSLWQTLQEKNC